MVTTLLLFSGWLRTERGTVIRAGSFPWNYRYTENIINKYVLFKRQNRAEEQ